MKIVLIILISLFMGEITGKAQEALRPRARGIGIEVGILPPGRYNAITDVEGVMVGHKTIIREGTDGNINIGRQYEPTIPGCNRSH